MQRLAVSRAELAKRDMCAVTGGIKGPQTTGLTTAADKSTMLHFGGVWKLALSCLSSSSPLSTSRPPFFFGDEMTKLSKKALNRRVKTHFDVKCGYAPLLEDNVSKQ